MADRSILNRPNINTIREKLGKVRTESSILEEQQRGICRGIRSHLL